MWPEMGSGVMVCIERIWKNSWVIRFLHGKSWIRIVRTFLKRHVQEKRSYARLFAVFFTRPSDEPES
jgi:hypothetical protein